MKNAAKSIVPVTALALLLLSLAPLASASTLNVNLNPTTGLAQVSSVSTTKIVFTYPANSTMSQYLKDVNSSFSLAGSFDSTSPGVQALQGSFDDSDSHISVKNATVSIGYTAKGSPTELDVMKSTNVTAWVSGVFKVVNGTVTANLGWRAFVVRGPMNFDMGNRMVDINLVGSTMEDSMSSHSFAAGFMFNAFGGGSLWDRPTLNFSALNSPLSTWTKNYNSATNTTTFSKAISGQSTFTASADLNGQKYSLSSTSDPSGTVTVQGYANASGDSLVMATPPASMGSGILVVGAVIAALAALGGYFAIKRGVRPKAPLAY